MNFTTGTSLNKSISPIIGCGIYLFRQEEKLATEDFSVVLLSTVIINSITCPFTIMLNVLVMVAVKTKPWLRKNSNIVLACLATTDLMIGVVVQPLYVTMGVFKLTRKTEFCTTYQVMSRSILVLCYSSMLHLALVSGDRYFAIKRPYSYHNTITKKRLMVASALVWILAIASFPLYDPDEGKVHLLLVLFRNVPQALIVVLTVTCHIVVYREVLRHEKQICEQQVSEEVRRRLQKEKKALKTTTIIVTAVFVCYFPVIATMLLKNVKTSGQNTVLVALSSVMLNSVINPLIYTARNREFRTAVIQLLTGRNAEQARETEIRIFRSRTDRLREGRIQQGVEEEGEDQSRNNTNERVLPNAVAVFVPGQVGPKRTGRQRNSKNFDSEAEGSERCQINNNFNEEGAKDTTNDGGQMSHSSATNGRNEEIKAHGIDIIVEVSEGHPNEPTNGMADVNDDELTGRGSLLNEVDPREDNYDISEEEPKDDGIGVNKVMWTNYSFKTCEVEQIDVSFKLNEEEQRDDSFKLNELEAKDDSCKLNEVELTDDSRKLNEVEPIDDSFKRKEVELTDDSRKLNEVEPIDNSFKRKEVELTDDSRKLNEVEPKDDSFKRKEVELTDDSRKLNEVEPKDDSIKRKEVELTDDSRKLNEVEAIIDDSFKRKEVELIDERFKLNDVEPTDDRIKSKEVESTDDSLKSTRWSRKMPGTFEINKATSTNDTEF